MTDICDGVAPNLAVCVPNGTPAIITAAGLLDTPGIGVSYSPPPPSPRQVDDGAIVLIQKIGPSRRRAPGNETNQVNQ